MIIEHLGLSPRVAWLIEGGGHCQIGVGTAILGGAGISGISSLIGGGKQASAAKEAAQIQANAAMQAAALQQQRFEEVKKLLTPFVDYGTNVIPSVQALTGTTPGADPTAPLTAPLTKLPDRWEPTMENLKNMPGYLFEKNAAEQAGANMLSSTGLYGSGAGISTIQSIAGNLAARNWQSNWAQFAGQQNLDMAGRAQTYNQLTGMVHTGLEGAAALGGVGIQSAGQVGNALQAAGAAQGAGVATAGNIAGQMTSNIGGIGSNALTMYAMDKAGYFNPGGTAAADAAYEKQVMAEIYGPGPY